MDANIQRDQLEKIRHFLALEYYDSAIKESSTLLEEILKKIFQKAISEFTMEDRKELFEAEATIGKNKKSYRDFGFGELVGLYRVSKLLDRWERNTSQSLGIIKSVSLDYIVDLRNSLTHAKEGVNNCTKIEADLVFELLKNWLSFIGYSEIDSGIKKATHVIKKEAASQSENLIDEPSSKEVDYLEAHLKSRVKSVYKSSTLTEKKRLSIQYEFSKDCDHNAFIYGLKNLKKAENLVGLDVGCADGTMTVKRFKDEYDYKRVIGVDYNADSVAKSDKFKNEVFSFHQLDVESIDFESQLTKIMEENDVEGFDTIYFGYTIHHLNNPIRVLRKIRRFLNDGGFLILTGIDDGAQLSYGDDNLMRKIIDLHIKTEGISDRFHGRKFFTYLLNAGYKDIRMQYSVHDTTQMNAEEKELLYQFNFGARGYYTATQLEKDPNNKQKQLHHEALIQALNELEDVFQKPDFYYSIMTISSVGFKG